MLILGSFSKKRKKRSKSNLTNKSKSYQNSSNIEVSLVENEIIDQKESKLILQEVDRDIVKLLGNRIIINPEKLSISLNEKDETRFNANLPRNYLNYNFYKQK